MNCSVTDTLAQSVGIFGFPLKHVLSPSIQQAALDYSGLSVRYHAWPVSEKDLPGRIDRIREPKYLGANVTIPYKETVLTMLDLIDPLAQSVGAVNTIVNRGGILEGYNTDVTGFLTSLRESGGFEPKSTRALIFGAGGAARAAIFGLVDVGVEVIGVANRTFEKGQALAQQVTGEIEVLALSIGSPSLLDYVSSVNLIVNCTSMGMKHSSVEGVSPLSATSIPNSALVYDMVYTPSETPLLKEAHKAGAKVVGGLPMLVYQGAAAFELWTGRKASVEVMFQAAERVLSGNSDSLK